LFVQREVCAAGELALCILGTPC